MQNTVFDYYSRQISALESELKKTRKAFPYLYLSRLVTFISFVVFLILFFQFDYRLLLVSVSLISLILFLFTVKHDLKLDYKEKLLSNKLLINQNELKFLEHQYDKRETGVEFNYLNPHLAADFDIFGKGSLFQYLNRCSTVIGRTKLAENLCQFQKEEKLIIAKQDAIKELSGKNEFIQDFQTYGMFISENGGELANLQTWLNQSPDNIKLMQRSAIVMTLITAVWIGLIITGIFTITSLILPILVNFFILSLHAKKLKNELSMLGNSDKNL